MNIRKRHIHYSRALSDALAKYVDRKNIPALRDEIARIVDNEIIATYIVEQSDDLNSNIVDCYQSIQRGILTGDFDDEAIKQQIQLMSFIRSIESLEAKSQP